MNEPNITYIITKVKQKIDGTEWSSILGHGLILTDHIQCRKSFTICNESGLRFTPKYSDAFNAFLHCPVRSTEGCDDRARPLSSA